MTLGTGLQVLVTREHGYQLGAGFVLVKLIVFSILAKRLDHKGY